MSSPLEGDVPRKKPRPPVFFDIPMGTPARTCNGPTCGRVLYWSHTGKGAKMPVDVSSVAGCQAPTATASGRGVAHWGYCPDRERFSGRGNGSK